MPPVVVVGRTREQIRVSVGQNVGGVKLLTSAVEGTTTTFLSDGLYGGGDDHNGKRLQFTGPINNDGVTALVVDSSIAAYRTTLTFFPAGTAPALSDTAELWDMRFDPARIHEFINQAILEVTGLAYDPEESLVLHGDGRARRFDIPSQFAMVDGIYRRKSVESKQIHLATTAWADAVDADVTASQDTKDYKLAPGSLKLVVVAAASAGDVLATKTITSIDISGYDYVEFWIKSTVATVAGDLQLLLDNTAGAVSPLETLNVPALVADTWTYVRVALANPELDTAIISVGLKYTVDIGAVTIWLNDIKAVLDSTAFWVRVDKNNWRADGQARDLVMTFAPPYQLLKLTGGDKPVQLTTDAGVNEVDDQFVIARATELALLSSGGGPSTDPDALRSLAGYWGNRAAEAKRNLALLTNVRVVS